MLQNICKIRILRHLINTVWLIVSYSRILWFWWNFRMSKLICSLLLLLVHSLSKCTNNRKSSLAYLLSKTYGSDIHALLTKALELTGILEYCPLIYAKKTITVICLLKLTWYKWLLLCMQLQAIMYHRQCSFL